MAITLVPMTSEEYEKFYQMSRDNQVNDLVAGGKSREDAIAATEAELAQLLPDGQDTEENFLMMIKKEDDLTEVGYIWTLHEFTGDTMQSFLCDLVIYEDYRGQGFAKEALCQMEKSAYTYGCEESILFVKNDNTKAISLYQAWGYQTFREESDGMYMRKKLTRDLLDV
jgi:ribosomal protein S18 acetylase RimI-like enzyme